MPRPKGGGSAINDSFFMGGGRADGGANDSDDDAPPEEQKSRGRTRVKRKEPGAPRAVRRGVVCTRDGNEGTPAVSCLRVYASAPASMPPLRVSASAARKAWHRSGTTDGAGVSLADDDDEQADSEEEVDSEEEEAGPSKARKSKNHPMEQSSTRAVGRYQEVIHATQKQVSEIRSPPLVRVVHAPLPLRRLSVQSACASGLRLRLRHHSIARTTN
jgi:hypothetical protein